VTILSATGLAKSFGPHTVLASVDLSIHAGERVGLVGANGSGKSTLAKILAGEEQADTGELAIRRDARVMYLAQEPALDPAVTVLDCVLSGLSAWWAQKTRYEAASAVLAGRPDDARALVEQADSLAELFRLGGFDVSHRALAVLSSLNVRDPEARVGTLSGGERRRAALARVLVAEPDLAIFDEPTNHLDIDAISWLESYLADQYRGAVLLITHDRYFLDGVVDRTLEVERGRVYGYEGGFADYLRGKAERIAMAERTEQNRQNFLRKELDWLSRSPPARTTKQRARIERAEAAVGNRPAPKNKKLDLELVGTRSGKTILSLHRVCIDTPSGASPTRRLVTDLSFDLTEGERVGILGANGAGKSTLLKAVLGEHPVVGGELTLGKNARVAYLSQHRQGLDEDRTILENVAEGGSHVRVGDRDVHAMTYLEKFLFTGADVRKPVKALSGGERTRVALARLLRQQTNLLLLDEPTNDLDLDTLAALEELILEHNITTMVVTHDRWFLDRVATSVLWFEGDGRVTRFAGNYTTVSEYRAQQADERKQAARVKASEARAPELAAAAANRKKPGLSYKEQRELEQVEARIAELEDDIAKRETELADPAFYTERAAEIAERVAARDKLKAELDTLMERWAALEEKRAQ
jgi:ABC transport system ATP-binding/permease protein